MPANTTPIFALSPDTKLATITAATTDKSGATTTNIVDLLTATTNGTKVTQIKFKSTGNSSACLGLVWVTDTAGINPRLLAEGAIAAVTSSTTVATAEIILYFRDLQLKSGQKIQVGATVVTTNIHITASIGDF